MELEPKTKLLIANIFGSIIGSIVVLLLFALVPYHPWWMWIIIILFLLLWVCLEIYKGYLHGFYNIPHKKK